MGPREVDMLIGILDKKYIAEGNMMFVCLFKFIYNNCDY